VSEDGTGADADGPGGPGSGPDVGSVAEEAAKLFGALSGWARDQGADLGAGMGGLVDQAARAAHDLDEHLATGAAECSYCPICRTVHAVRQASPEVRAHLATAASSLLQAAMGALATRVPDPGRGAGVEHIDLDAETAEWPEEDDR
jgi:hypothetical protein